MNPRAVVALLLVAALARDISAQSVRSRIRSSPRATTVSGDQAVDLTLTVAPAAVRPIQLWVRGAGVLVAGGRLLTLYLPTVDAAAIKVDQRVRAFPVQSRSSMYQARVSRVAPAGGRTRVEITLVAPPHEDATRYLVEIVTDRGDYLSVPNEAIIEEGARRIVYVKRAEGQYQPQEITIGMQGELYAQVLSGVKNGEQVVTFGSFFVDADFKLKGGASQP